MTLVAPHMFLNTKDLHTPVQRRCQPPFRCHRVRVRSGGGRADESRQEDERHRPLQLDRVGWVERQSTRL